MVTLVTLVTPNRTYREAEENRLSPTPQTRNSAGHTGNHLPPLDYVQLNSTAEQIGEAPYKETNGRRQTKRKKESET